MIGFNVCYTEGAAARRRKPETAKADLKPPPIWTR
jgi:hypothetical protein